MNVAGDDEQATMTGYNEVADFERRHPTLTLAANVALPVVLVAVVVGFVAVTLAASRQRLFGQHPVAVYVIALSVVSVVHASVEIGAQWTVLLGGRHLSSVWFCRMWTLLEPVAR